ncbi:MAG: MBL fold metallo-hydrolase [Ruminococcaceae bacterium]|nr:MBL fold metallo-hydrolase [Oscillospiraceae bacterium]
MKRYLAWFTALLLTVLLLIFCGGESTPSAETTLPPDTTAPVETTPPAVDMDIIRDGTANYTIVRPENGDQVTVSAAALLRTQIEQATGTAPALTTDWIKPGTEYDHSTLEILIGNTGYSESAEALQSITYGDYIIKQIGSKLVINAWDPENLGQAISVLLTKVAQVSEGTFIVPANTVHTETANEILHALPIYADEDFPSIYPTGSDNHLVLIESTTPEAYAAYCTELEKAGFTRYTGKKTAGNEFATYTNDQYVINAGFYDYYDEVRIIIEPDTALPPLESEAAAHTVTPSFTAIGLEFFYNDPDKPLQNGQSFIWQLADGSYIIVDGGVNRTYDSKTLYDFMREHAPDPDNVVISAWILTHAHGDHHGGFVSFCSSYYINRVTIKHVIANYPSDRTYAENGSNPESTKKVMEWAERYSEDGFIKAHVGQTFHFGGAVLEILYTTESYLPKIVDNFNTTSMIFTVDIAGQRFLITGDATNAGCAIAANMFGSYLKSDFVQITHHGAGVAEDGSTIRGVTDLYSLAEAPIILWPSGQRAYNAYYTETRNAHALNLPSTKEIFVAGSRITTILLPYTPGTSGYDTILK